jgi:copper chaperone
MVQREYRVPEVSCAHCVAAIKGELTTIAGIQAVDVDLEKKMVTVLAADDVDDAAIVAGIEEAGYEVAA